MKKPYRLYRMRTGKIHIAKRGFYLTLCGADVSFAIRFVYLKTEQAVRDVLWSDNMCQKCLLSLLKIAKIKGVSLQSLVLARRPK